MRNAADTHSSPLFTRLFGATAVVVLLAASSPAFALSELQPTVESDPGESNASDQTGDASAETDNPGIPMPDPLVNRSRAQAEPVEQPAESSEPAAEQTDETAAPVEIIRDFSALPEPVRRMRELMIEAAASGDIEKMRSLMNPGPNQTQLNGEGDDPVEALKSYSGDAEGQEILAILIDLLSTGAVHLDAGTPEEAYVWPYFAGKTLSSLTPPERVELLRIVTAGDLMNMEETGNYNFYRVGITPDGQWKFFSGGD
ncbi:hypothetical protein [Rhizobium sp. LCM 4573]|uniref:hypothetical protein n=1 Tax=Rhizobium sp. LCM 4573 TaxID=1848291 RepID=UPI0008D8FD94|nr:hypothetical protein [Rhizobium sp. LCM 4573]OHV76234.1 hypothetical protein LCM4573_11345 [Rhizobium sp. LCM 4573]